LAIRRHLAEFGHFESIDIGPLDFSIAVGQDHLRLLTHVSPYASIRADISLLWDRMIAAGTSLRATTVRKWKAGSCEPNRYQAVPSQRAIGMG